MNLNRRSFLKLSLSIPASAGLAGRALEETSTALGRVASPTITVHAKADLTSPVIRTIPKDTVLPLLDHLEAKSPYGNPRWHRVSDGYAHSGNLQPVAFLPQQVAFDLKPPAVAEVTMPITQCYQTIEPKETILYRLYFGSIHTVTDLVYGRHDKPWYAILDPRLKMTFYVPAEHMRILQPEEYAPIHPEVPSGDKTIRIRLGDQTLTAFEGSTEVYHCLVSAGIPSSGGNDSNMTTPKGDFRVAMKTPTAHMGDGRLTKDPLAYELPGVPWVSYFETTQGIALHGAYWHNDFGRPRSHGCVNLAIADSLWLYRWTNPPALIAEGVTKGYGTRVHVE